MADSIKLDEARGVYRKYHDNGDGSVSEFVHVDDIISVGDITIGTAVEINNDSGNPVPITGAKTPNSAIPGANNVGSLPGVANAVAPTYTETYQVAESMDLSGNLRVTEGTLLFGEDATNNIMATGNKPVASGSYSGTAFTAQLNDVDITVKATPGNLLAITVSSTNAGARYLQLHNKASAPAAGETAIMSFSIPAGTVAQPSRVGIGCDMFGCGGLYFSTGIAVGISTVAATFTAATTTDHIINGIYV